MTSTEHSGDSGRSRSRALTLAAAASMALACGDATGPGDEVTSHDVSLGVGESATYEADGNVLSLRLPPASSGREYRLAVQSADVGTPLQFIPMRLTLGDGGSSGAGSISSNRRVAAVGGSMSSRTRDLVIRQRLQENSRRLLVRRGVRPALVSGSSVNEGISRRSRVPTDTVPNEGDQIEFWFAAQEDLTTPCDTASAETVTAQVKRVGERAIIVQDTGAPDGGATGDGFSADDFDQIVATFDTLVVPVNSQYFGSPTDIDKNGHVYILFTPKVNELDRPAQDVRLGGFFVPNDLAESGNEGGEGELKQGETCPASNESELLYLRAPDPNGQFGLNTSADEARRNAYSVSSHELQHLVNAANRIIKNPSGGFFDLETAWLSEGLSHLAEEVVGLAALDASVRTNLNYDETRGTNAQIFDTYLVNDFYNARALMRESQTARALASQDTTTTASLEMRGFGWLFLRWLADHEVSADGAVPGSGEESLIRDLAQADGNELSTGVTNVEEVTGASFETLLADFGLMVALDDDADGADGAQVLRTWNLRDMYAGLAAAFDQFGNAWGSYPLNPVESGFTDGFTDFEVRPGPGKHFTISSTGSTPGLELRLTDQTGGALSSGSRARIVVFRAR